MKFFLIVISSFIFLFSFAAPLPAVKAQTVSDDIIDNNTVAQFFPVYTPYNPDAACSPPYYNQPCSYYYQLFYLQSTDQQQFIRALKWRSFFGEGWQNVPFFQPFFLSPQL